MTINNQRSLAFFFACFSFMLLVSIALLSGNALDFHNNKLNSPNANDKLRRLRQDESTVQLFNSEPNSDLFLRNKGIGQFVENWIWNKKMLETAYSPLDDLVSLDDESNFFEKRVSDFFS